MNIVSIQTLNQLTQEFSKIKEVEFKKNTQAIKYFYDKINDALNQGFMPIFEVADQEGYMERHYSNGNVTVILVLDLCGDCDSSEEVSQ